MKNVFLTGNIPVCGKSFEMLKIFAKNIEEMFKEMFPRYYMDSDPIRMFTDV